MIAAKENFPQLTPEEYFAWEEMYRHNPVLQDYLLVSSTSIEMDLYHKNDAGEWLIVNYQEGDTIELKSINLSFAIEQVYRGLNLTPESESTI